MQHAPVKNTDWATLIDQGKTEYEGVILKNDGSFEIEFDLRETSRDPNEEQEFELAFVFAKHSPKGRDGTSQSIAWDPNPIAKTDIVGSLKIPASPKLSLELQLINEACRWPFYDPDSTKLIRAVNALQPLGKKKTLQILAEYVSLTDDLYADDHEIVFWIIQLLFEPSDLQLHTP